ncbi:MAG: TPM domain-containing protein [Porphyromonas sp.]|nr:TPM domain-containing protein [Porphyromonas sp.]
MRKYIYITLLLLLYLSFFPVYGQKLYTIDEVPNVHLQDRNQYVSDPEGVLSSDTRNRLNAVIANVMQKGDIEIAVVVIPGMVLSKYGSEREFANRLFNTWGIGNKDTDRGLLMLLFTDMDQRSITFETGYGLEGDLPDGLCSIIQNKVMIPIMKEGNYGEGLIAGVEAIDDVLGGTSPLKQEYESVLSEDKEAEIIGWGIFLLFVLIAGKVLYDVTIKEVFSEMKKSVHDPYLTMVKLRESPFDVGLLISSMIVFCAIPALVVMVIWFWIIKYIYRKSVVCESCGVAGKTRYKGNYIAKEASVQSSGIKLHEFVCKNCGHVHVEQTAIRLWDKRLFGSGYRDGLVDYKKKKSGGRWRGRGFGGGSGSSGSSGGSWGGGSSGGGGSSSKF